MIYHKGRRHVQQKQASVANYNIILETHHYATSYHKYLLYSSPQHFGERLPHNEDCKSYIQLNLFRRYWLDYMMNITCVQSAGRVCSTRVCYIPGCALAWSALPGCALPGCALNPAALFLFHCEILSIEYMYLYLYVYI